MRSNNASRPGGPPAKREPRPEGLGYGWKMMSAVGAALHRAISGRSTTLRTFSAIFLLLTLNGVAGGQRLPTGVVPSHYKLFLDPSIESQRFSGEETIDVRLTHATKEIVLNSLDLEISAAEVDAGGNSQPAQISYEPANEMIRLAVGADLPSGPAVLHLKFSGPLTSGLRGLYLSKTARRSYLVTQFEGTYARMMFPGFDEPGFKATFDLTVVADKQDTAISNGRIIRDAPTADPNRHALTFSTSPRMSTYLVAVAIGDWQCLGSTVDGVPSAFVQSRRTKIRDNLLSKWLAAPFSSTTSGTESNIPLASWIWWPFPIMSGAEWRTPRPSFIVTLLCC